MSDVWDKFKNWFQKADDSSASQPFIHEIISRSEEDQAAYDRWKDSLSQKRLLNWLHEQYVQHLIPEADTDAAIDFLNTPTDKGFVIHFNQTRYPRQEIDHLFHYLKERVLSQGYRSYVSDTKTYQQGDSVETVNRHYLKPKLSDQLRQGDPRGKVFQQGFGNITIDMLLRNDQVRHLKFRATSYRDRQFAEADEFGDLMRALVA